jgi:hypothetical protein
MSSVIDEWRAGLHRRAFPSPTTPGARRGPPEQWRTDCLVAQAPPMAIRRRKARALPMAIRRRKARAPPMAIRGRMARTPQLAVRVQGDGLRLWCRPAARGDRHRTVLRPSRRVRRLSTEACRHHPKQRRGRHTPRDRGMPASPEAAPRPTPATRPRHAGITRSSVAADTRHETEACWHHPKQRRGRHAPRDRCRWQARTRCPQRSAGGHCAERRVSRSSIADTKQSSGAVATPAPIWPTPAVAWRMPVLTFGVMPSSAT